MNTAAILLLLLAHFGKEGKPKTVVPYYPHSMRAYVRRVGLPVFWKSWGALEQLRSGKPAVSDIFAYFKEPGDGDLRCE